MKDSLEEREKAEEARFKLDEERRFKTEARRNRLVGLWAAERLGITGDEAEAFAKEVVRADFKEPGSDDVLRKVLEAFEERGVAIAETEVSEEMDRQFKIAMAQIAEEYPHPLGPDHQRVGD